jgi:hypothetical protein
MAKYISVGEALKLVSPFMGDKREVLAFISNVDTAFDVTHPENAEILYKFVLTRISGEPRVTITHRNLENWGDLKVFLKNTYTEKRTLDFHATQSFGARQSKNENVSEWIQKIQRLSSKFREAALQDCEEDERVGIVALADIPAIRSTYLYKICCHAILTKYLRKVLTFNNQQGTMYAP